MFTDSENLKISLIEVKDAEALAGSLFMRSFRDAIPNFPKHFVLMAVDDSGRALTLGYVHFTKHLSMYLGGGMCVNTRALRDLPSSLRKQLNSQGGVAFTMLSEAVRLLHDCDAVFGFVGHKGAYKIDLSVGFQQTEHPHLIVYWKQELNSDEQQQTIQSAAEFGPF